MYSKPYFITKMIITNGINKILTKYIQMQPITVSFTVYYRLSDV